MTDAELHALLQAGDAERAATETIRTLGPPVLRLLRAIVPVEVDAADAFSLWAETVWRALPDYRAEGSLKAWSLRIARSAARRVRDDAWHRHRERLPTTAAERLATELRTASVIRDERRRTALDGLRAELTDDERLLLVLRIDQNLAWNDVAEVMSTSDEAVEPAALMKRFERLKARIGQLAKERGLLE